MARPQQGKSPIKDWETLDLVESQQQEVGKTTVGVVLQVVQPVFHDGGRGRPRLEFKVNRGDRFLRFQVPDEGEGEIGTLTDLMLLIRNHSLDEGTKKLSFRLGVWEDEKYNQRQQEIADHNERVERDRRSHGRGGNRSVGKGLGQYTKGSKTERKKKKRQRTRNGVQDG